MSTPTDAEELVRFAREMVALGLVTGTAGNLSVRLPDGTILVTPSGVDYATMVPDQLVGGHHDARRHLSSAR
jgi:ribulose-5-phosphate 4-epimerase/fuculose-1-phosphate aldolase